MVSGQSRILVVDDEQRLTDLLETLLEENGYVVEAVGSAGAMLDRIAEQPPDLILLDVMLPDLDGFKALEQIRLRETSNRIPVIMLTGLTDPTFRTRGIRSGADDYVGKPFDLDELLSRVSLRIDQARAIRDQRRAAVGSGLQAIGKVAASEHGEDIGARVTAFTCELLNSSASAMMLWREDEQAFTAAGCTGFEPQEQTVFNSMRIPAGSYEPIDNLIYARRAFAGSEVEPDAFMAWILPELQLCKVAGVPIAHEQHLRGLLLAGRGAASPEFAADDIELLTRIAGQAGVALANVHAIEELEQQAVTDGLTGLYNPRYLREFLAHEIARAKRSDEGTAVLMLDLDNFKQINDSYGHLAGDKVLVAVASTIRACVRDSDTVARYGGDEFAVVLMGASRRQAERVAQRILQRIRETAIDIGETSVFLSISAGIATASSDDDARSVMHLADSALYEAKSAGRDCIR